MACWRVFNIARSWYIYFFRCQSLCAVYIRACSCEQTPISPHFCRSFILYNASCPLRYSKSGVGALMLFLILFKSCSVKLSKSSSAPCFHGKRLKAALAIHPSCFTHCTLCKKSFFLSLLPLREPRKLPCTKYLTSEQLNLTVVLIGLHAVQLMKTGRVWSWCIVRNKVTSVRVSWKSLKHCKMLNAMEKMTESHCLCFKHLANSSGQIHLAMKVATRQRHDSEHCSPLYKL